MKDSLPNILNKMVEPYHDGTKKVIDFYLKIATCAWNSTILPIKEATEIVDELLTLFDYDDSIIELLDNFKSYKDTNFPDDERIIVDYTLFEEEEKLFINVEYTVLDNLNLVSND